MFVGLQGSGKTTTCSKVTCSEFLCMVFGLFGFFFSLGKVGVIGLLRSDWLVISAGFVSRKVLTHYHVEIRLQRGF